jgi:hypothetical protein
LGNDMTGHVRAVAEGGGGTFVATDESLLQFTSTGLTDFGWKKRLSDHTLIALHYDDPSQTLWVSTNQGLVRLKSGGLARFPTPDVGVLTRIRSIATDHEDGCNATSIAVSIDRRTARDALALVARDKRRRRCWPPRIAGCGSVSSTARSGRISTNGPSRSRQNMACPVAVR